MKASASIARHDVKKDPLSFYSLRKTGIGYAQQFSGEIWTDFNAHDPGVTILEQLCYGLSELNYRTDFNVEDHLAQPDGYLDLTKLALAPPEDIMPSRACTAADYQNLLLDGIEEIDRLWITPLTSDYLGLYKIELQLTPTQRSLCQARPSLADKIIDKVSQVFGKNRNLGEDIGEICIIEDSGYELVASLELSDNYSAEHLLSKIYHVCQQWLMGELLIENYEDLKNQGQELDNILLGPKTLHGRYQIIEGQTATGSRTLSSLYSQIRSIEGIDVIKHLALTESRRRSYGSPAKAAHVQQTQAEAHTQAPEPAQAREPTEQGQNIRGKSWLHIPDDPQDIHITLQRNGQPVKIDFETFRSHVEHRQFKQYSMRHTRQEVSSLYQAIEGSYRQLNQYHSVQLHFPVHYNLSLMGVQVSGDPLAKAKANQLKGYLLIFDQLMANFSKNINNLKTLFSIDRQSTQSYQFYHFEPTSLKDIGTFYPESPKAIFDELLAKFDHFYDRKGRVLDYLLALYGESLDQTLLRQFNFYDSQSGLEQQLLDNKYHYLTSVVALGRDRGAGFDYRSYREFERNIGGFQCRLSCHLGMQLMRWPYMSTIKRQPLDIVADHAFLQANFSHHNQVMLNDAMAKNLISIPLMHVPMAQDEKAIAKMFLSLLPFKHNVIGETFFRKGVDINHFKLVKRERDSQYDLFFTLQQGRDLNAQDLISHQDMSCYLGSSADVTKANRLANILRQHLVFLNRSCEGIYVVEHLLLRPEARAQSETSATPDPASASENPTSASENQSAAENQHGAQEQAAEEDFYSFRLSVIFPGFSARCADAGFRRRAQEIVRAQCPAHIYPQCYWLDFANLCEFEQAYMQWQELRRASHQASEECQHSAKQLVTLLKGYQSASLGEEYEQ